MSGLASEIGGALGDLVSAVAGFGARTASAVGQWAKQKLIDFAAWLGIDPATIEYALAFAERTIAASLTRIVNVVKAIPATIGNWLADIFSMKDYSAEDEAGFRDAGRRVGKTIVDGIKSAFAELWVWLASLPDRIVAAIGKIDLSSIIRLPSFPFGSAPPVLDVPQAVPQSAPMAPRSGPSERHAMNLIPSRGSVTVNNGPVTFHVANNDPEGAARAIMRALDRRRQAGLWDGALA